MKLKNEMEGGGKKLKASLCIFDAVNDNNLELCKFLLNSGYIDPNARNNDEDTPLMEAATFGLNKMVELLLLHPNIDVNARDITKKTALMCAVGDENFECTKLLLLDARVNINAQDKDGDTAFIYASSYGNVEMTKLFLNHCDTDINVLNIKGLNAIEEAASYKRVETLKLLLARGMSIQTKLKYGTEINEMIRNKNTYLLPWNRFKTYKYYPAEFTEIARHWMLVCLRLKVFPKDLQYLMIEYIAEVWKGGWSREDVIKSLYWEIEILKKLNGRGW